MDSWNQANADAMTVDSWGGGTQLSAFPPLVPVNGGHGGLFQCPTHPQHRTEDPTSFCPLCEANWQSQRQELQAKRQSVEEQLQNLQDVDSAAAILQDLQVSMKEWKPQAEEDPRAVNNDGNNNNNMNGNMNGPRNDFFGRTHPNNNNNNGNRGGGGGAYQSYQPNSRQRQETPPPSAPPSMNGPPPSFFTPFPYDQTGGGAGGPGGGQSPPQMQAFAMQLHSMQRMQDWMLWQKEQECQALRNNLEEMRTEVQQLRVDKALLQEKLYQQEERMKHELKLIKLAALQQQKSGGAGNHNPAYKKPSVVGNGAATSKGTTSPTRDSFYNNNNNNNRPIVLLPEHMLSSTSNGNSNGSRSNTPASAAVNSSTTPSHATHHQQQQQQSAFGTPAAPKATNVSLASYQSGDSPQKKQQEQAVSSDIRRSKSHDESVKSGQSGKSQQSGRSGKSKDSSRNSIGKRLVKPAGSWILGRGRNRPQQQQRQQTSPSGPVDTDHYVPQDDDDDDDDGDDHEPVGIPEHPEMPTEPEDNDDDDDDDNNNNNLGIVGRSSSGGDDGYGTDESDDDDDFDKMVRGAGDLPEMEDIFPSAPAASPPSAGPVRVVNVAQNTAAPARDEISGLTLFTNREGPGNQTPPPPSAGPRRAAAAAKNIRQYKQTAPVRGVSFPDTAVNRDDDASVGNTVASSTFGEDRHKVVDQVILDPYGDKGTYTGIILRSTGM